MFFFSSFLLRILDEKGDGGKGLLCNMYISQIFLSIVMYVQDFHSYLGTVSFCRPCPGKDSRRLEGCRLVVVATNLIVPH